MNLDNIDEAKDCLIAFERKLAKAYLAGEVRGPAHFSSGNEEQIIKIFRGLQPRDWAHAGGYSKDDFISRKLIEIPAGFPRTHPIFQGIKKEDWVCASYRSHYHALLKGISEDSLERSILEGRSMYPLSSEHNFMTSAIVPGHIPIAVGIALGIKRRGLPNHVWAFCGDMAYETGVFEESSKYAGNFELPLTFVIEDNGVSVDTPTEKVWNGKSPLIRSNVVRYFYKNSVPHQGCGREVGF